jgi:AcrR family transcriptional regulator
VTIESISEAVDVSPRTFFNYFSSKEEALMGDTPHLAGPLQAGLRDTPAGDPLAPVLRAAVTQAALETAHQREDLRLLRQVCLEHPVLLARRKGEMAAEESELTGTVAAHLGSDPTTDLRPAVMVAMSISALRVAFMAWPGKDEGRLIELINEAFDLLEEGL